MPNRKRRGDFLVPQSELDEAEDVFESRSKRSRATDASLRAPITYDIDRYKRLNGRGVDYPGVDTPTSNPTLAAGDFSFPNELDQVTSDSTGMKVDFQEDRPRADEGLPVISRESKSPLDILLDK